MSAVTEDDSFKVSNMDSDMAKMAKEVLDQNFGKHVPQSDIDELK